MPNALSLEDARASMAGLAAWSLDEASMRLTRSLDFTGFPAAMRFVNALAELAEARNHHPDFSVHFKRVEIVLWSHDANGLTKRDFALADAINELVASRPTW